MGCPFVAGIQQRDFGLTLRINIAHRLGRWPRNILRTRIAIAARFAQERHISLCTGAVPEHTLPIPPLVGAQVEQTGQGRRFVLVNTPDTLNH